MLPGLKPLRGRARWAIGAVAVVMVADMVTIWSDVLEIDLMNRLIDDGEVFPALSEEAFDDVESNDNRQLAVASVYGAAYIAAIVFFIRWFWSAYWNLRLLGQPGARYHPAWAIVSWFVPIFNVWRPKQIANDIWRGSEPERAGDPERRLEGHPPAAPPRGVVGGLDRLELRLELRAANGLEPRHARGRQDLARSSTWLPQRSTSSLGCS